MKDKKLSIDEILSGYQLLGIDSNEKKDTQKFDAAIFDKYGNYNFPTDLKATEKNTVMGNIKNISLLQR